MLTKKLVFTYIIALSLILNAGWIDSVVLYKSFGASVAAMTGNYRILGHSIAEADIHFAIQVSILVIGFIIGAAINGIIIRTDNDVVPKSHSKALVLQSCILLIGTMLIDIHGNASIIDDIFLAIAMGMQNSFTTLFFGGFARTTHMTGTTTDLGIEIGRMIRGDKSNIWKIPFFTICILTFILGNTMGAFWVMIAGDLFTFMLFPSVLLPIIVGLFMLIVYKFEKKKCKSDIYSL